MTELRHDPLFGHWILVAPNRRERPGRHRYEPATPTAPDPDCPFCPGSEAKTPPEAAAIREGASERDTPGWSVRCVPNKYPAIENGQLRKLGAEPFGAFAGGGYHEVLVDSPAHEKGLADLPDLHAASVLLLLQRRVRVFFENESVRAVAVFKNHGALAGASIPHSHLQILGLPVPPPLTARKREREAQHLQETGSPLLAELISREYGEKTRMIETGAEGAVVFCPFAARLPYLVRIAPWPCEARFAEASPATLAVVGGALARTLRRIKRLLGDPPVNACFHLETREDGPGAHAWLVEVFPRLTGLAGLEAGTGMHINEIAPERAAEELRGVNFRK